jgi:uncharacterized protein DUF1566/List-Bact-rpt repeat protein
MIKKKTHYSNMVHYGLSLYCFLFLMVTVFSGVAVAADLFYEDFESFTEDSYPTSFTQIYNGTGDVYQKVMTVSGYDNENTKVFRLEGRSSWASEHYVLLPDPLPSIVVLDAYIKPVSGSWPGRFGLRNPSGTWGTRISAVLFDSAGKITALQNGNDSSKIEIGTYTINTWYRVTLEHDIINKVYTVYLDGVKLADNIPMHPTLAPTQLHLTAGNTGTNEIYYDDVRLLTGLNYSEVPRTGQGTCYDTAGDVINCSGTGQDGDLRMGVVQDGPRFTDNEDGTVTDNLTGLIWLKNANCLGYNNWEGSLTAVNLLASGACDLTDGSGAGDWRMPNINELASLLNRGYENPVLSNSAGNGQWVEGDPFTNLVLADDPAIANDKARYWSSSTANQYSTSTARSVYFSVGYMVSWDSKTSHVQPVWPVKGVSDGPAKVAKTGQTTHYGTAGNRDDGELQMGAAVASGIDRFTDNLDGTVTDNLTGLIWLKDFDCFAASSWETALTNAAGLADSACGLTDGSAAGDWRLPNINEAWSLLDIEETNPAIPTGNPFSATNLSGNYHTATSRTGIPDTDWQPNTSNAMLEGPWEKTWDKKVFMIRGGMRKSILTANSSGNGLGTVAGDGVYGTGTTQQLTATVGVESIFNGWGGDCSGTDNPLSVVLDKDKTCTATFTLNQYNLTVNSAGTGSGTVGGSGTYDYGTTHAITAGAGTGSTFTGWSGNCTGIDSPLDVLIDGDKTCIATFTLNQYLLTVNTSGTGSGTVGGGGTYDYGTTQAITANAGTGSSFTDWSGDCAGTESPLDVLIDGDKTCTANYLLNKYTLLVQKSGTGWGVISSSPAGIFCDTDCTGASYDYDHGILVTLQATPSSGSRFVGWSSPSCPDTGNCVITMEQATSLTATFTRFPWPIYLPAIMGGVR